MSTNKPASTAGASLADDLHQAGGLLSSIYGKAFPETHPVLLFLAAIWIAVERLHQAVQASAQADDWRSSEAATQAKGRELGIEARPKEDWSEYRARIASAMKKGGR
ncbi:MAG: hypothetical protein RBS05_14035 [Zoogloea oleivorans]|jgi:hypothetical protein|uniref:hypothetical protein n=1 Tax=Zoogloea oleivorans TaxID=1552750 RepID=UPI002A35F5AB|nr:hypothetical protein [Zoogloea oleivorans]MDY0037026.1 hypothetical protein [Zoogloea oleivorans]